MGRWSPTRVMLGAALLGAVLCVGALWMLAGLIRPAEADPELRAERTARAAQTEQAVARRVSHAHEAAVAAPADTGQEAAVALEISGVVEDPDGRPIAGAWVVANETVVYTDGRGRFSLSSAGDRSGVYVDATGYLWSWVSVVSGESDTGIWEVDPGDLHIVLEPVRELAVYCSGLPDDDCGTMLVMCTHPYVPVGDECRRDPLANGIVCACDREGPVAVRGGGRAVLVPAHESEAWLDFRDSATLTGVVEADGSALSDCNVSAVRIPHGLEDLPRGVMAIRRGPCEEDGRFAIDGLLPGDWELAVDSYVDGELVERVLVPRSVRAGQVLDVGVIELYGGGSIEGTVVDGLTGEPLHDRSVLAVREGEEDERVTPMGARTDEDGVFLIQGLPAGTWRVAPLLSPQAYLVVEVEDGFVTEGIEIETSEATALEENGFELVEEEGGLVVSYVAPDGPAMLGGLEEGDIIEGVQVGGLDLDMFEGADSKVSRVLLGHWDGPGITLVVDRAGEELEVPLEW